MLERQWRKSSHSGGGQGECLECRLNGEGQVEVRDSKDVDGGMLTFSPEGWDGFLAALKD